MAIFQVSSQQFMHVNCTYNMQVDGMTCFLFHGRVYLRSNYLYERIHIFSFLAGRPFPRLKFAFKIEIHIFYFLLFYCEIKRCQSAKFFASASSAPSCRLFSSQFCAKFENVSGVGGRLTGEKRPVL